MSLTKLYLLLSFNLSKTSDGHVISSIVNIRNLTSLFTWVRKFLPKFSASRCIFRYTLEYRPRPVMLALGKWRQEYQKFKVFLDYIVKVMLSYVTRHSVSK